MFKILISKLEVIAVFLLIDLLLGRECPFVATFWKCWVLLIAPLDNFQNIRYINKLRRHKNYQKNT